MKAKPKGKNRGGRPPVITPEVVETVGDYMAKGMPEEHACALAKVNAATFSSSVSRNPKLKAILTLKHAIFMDMALGRVMTGQDWTGFAWILERRYRPHFSRTDLSLQAQVAGGEFTLSEGQMKELQQMARAQFVPVKKAAK